MACAPKPEITGRLGCDDGRRVGRVLCEPVGGSDPAAAHEPLTPAHRASPGVQSPEAEPFSPADVTCGCRFRCRITMLRASQNAPKATGPLTITDPSSNGRPTEKKVVQLRHSRARQWRSRRRSGHWCGSLKSQYPRLYSHRNRTGMNGRAT